MTAEDDDIIMEKAVSNTLFSIRSNNTIIVDNYYEVIPISQNNDFVNYNLNNINTLEINPLKSLFDRDGQYLFHCEYNSQTLSECNLEFNYFTLDTNRSEYGYIKRGTNMQDAIDSTPTFKYRKYNTLDTGGEEEKGHDKLSMVYSFYDKDIYVDNGRTTVFNAPSSIYPYTQLNINDTTFTKNGAFSGPAPCIADKIYIKQDQQGRYQNGRYLCTWLSASSPTQSGIWVDRYYYPDYTTKEAALAASPIFNITYEKSVEKLLNIMHLEKYLVICLRSWIRSIQKL